jgi:nitrogen fixation-related uncharacterized protein
VVGRYVPFQVLLDILMAMKNAQVDDLNRHLDRFLVPDKLKEMEETVSCN